MTPHLTLRVLQFGAWREFNLHDPFRIGRGEECEVPLQDQYVSRVHARGYFQDGNWWLEDLNSSNGLYVGEERVGKTALRDGSIVRLGLRGLDLHATVENVKHELVSPPAPVFVPLPPPTTPAPLPIEPEPVIASAAASPVPPVKAQQPPAQPARGQVVSSAPSAERYFGKLKEGDVAGEHTMFIRSAFQQVQKKQKRKYGGVMVALLVLALILAGFGYRQYRKANQQRELAEQMFYTVKGLDVEIANLQQAVNASGSVQARQQLKAIEGRRVQMEDSYNNFLANLHIYESGMKEEDRLILRVARIFGECEVDMPKDFKSEVMKYIKYWQSGTRYSSDMKLAMQNGYVDRIAKEMVKEGMPPQFFYVAMQESDFKADISGPVTGVGIPKGMWQFMPATAVHYGLKLGPLVDERRPDVMDQRTHYELETEAASKYIKDLYGNDAEASGLLVMACYNWGQPQVLRLVRSMPPNPRDRNFWKLMLQHRNQVPKETYDYVFRIVAAAVIGENPRLFGFNFDNPLVAKS